MSAGAEHVRARRVTAINDPESWSGKVGLSAAVGVAYYVTARLSLGLLLEPDGMAGFWPAAGISSGVLIALGPHARWPVAVGVIAATISANIVGDRSLSAALAFALCDAAEALITAGLIYRHFGPSFHLGRLRAVLGLVAAAVVGPAVAGIGGAVGFRLFHSPDVPMLTSWRHWLASDAVGVLAVAPLFIGIANSVQRPPGRGEILEVLAAFGALIAMTMFVIAMPPGAWATAVPGALLAPILLWLAARFRSVFSAFGGFLVSSTVVWATIHGTGHFGDPDLPAEDRILQAQAFVVVVMLGALVIAALFAERRRAEARLAHSNMLLERERDNKLMNVEAAIAAITHDIRQPLFAIALHSAVGVKCLEKTPPDYQKAHESLSSVIAACHLTREIFESVRNSFRRVDESARPIDVNEIVVGALSLLRGELQDRGVIQHIHLAPELPLIPGNRNQLYDVLLNLVRNALEAMDGVPDRGVLHVRTELRGTDAILVTVRDSGPGIDGDKLDKIFDAFFTTKENGVGLGLTICRMIIDRHGGQLTAASDGNAGALFRILLPARLLGE